MHRVLTGSVGIDHEDGPSAQVAERERDECDLVSDRRPGRPELDRARIDEEGMLVAAVRVHDPDVIAAVESDLAAVRRPVRNLPLQRGVEGQLSRTATVSVDRPDLAVPDEDDLASVWRPGWEDVHVGARGQASGAAAVAVHDPEIGVGAAGAPAESDPASVR